ncbi:flagellar protein FliT [Pantoea sp.]|uniref:flagellar protein FliT n=1 Tax=Pantoea sp. TaxID=69393 RepID=UPI0031D08507
MSEEAIEQLLAFNQQLLMLAQSENWDEFVAGVEHYTNELKQLRAQDVSQLNCIDALQQLFAQDAILRQCIQTRLNSLSAEMTAMRKSRHSSQAYNAV